MESGIYTITNTVDGKMYVGLAVNMEQRWKVHKTELNVQKHANRHLQSAWNLYGKDSFLFEVLVECEIEYLCSEEHYWCNMLNVHNDKYGYNIQPTDPYGNARHAEETKAKISKAAMGNTQNIGRTASAERVAKIRKTKCETMGKPIVVLNARTGKYVCEQPSKGELAVWLGSKRTYTGNIYSVLKGKNRTPSLNGYVFVYRNVYDPAVDYTVKSLKQEIEQFDMDGNLIATYPTCADAAKSIDVKYPAFMKAIEGVSERVYKGYKWKRK